MFSFFSWIKDFVQMVFGNFWGTLTTLAMKLLLGPVAFYLFGPLFKISGKIAFYLLDKISVELGNVGLTTDSLLAWFVERMRLQECLAALMTFLIMGMMISIIKKVF